MVIKKTSNYIEKRDINVIAISNCIYENSSLYKKKNIHFIKHKNELTYQTLKQLAPNYVFFPHWSHIIPKEIYENFNCIIFHMTDLPFGRGGSPLQNLISRKIYDTKISAIQCIKEIDAGNIYLKYDLDISTGNAYDIYLKAGEIISTMIDEIIEKNPTPIPQQGIVTSFKRRKPEQSNISNLKDLETVYDYIRMLDAPNYPKAYLENDTIHYEFTDVKKSGDELLAKVRIRLKK